MPPTKKATRKVTPKAAGRAPAKKTVRKATKRSLTNAHKKALAEGRAMSATVNGYLSSLQTPKRRGRPVTKVTLEQRLTSARARMKTASGVQRVLTAQEVRDLQARLAQSATTTAVDTKRLEADFVRVAKRFGEQRGVSYGAFRDAGVPAVVLRRAGIARTRRSRRS